MRTDAAESVWEYTWRSKGVRARRAGCARRGPHNQVRRTSAAQRLRLRLRQVQHRVGAGPVGTREVVAPVVGGAAGAVRGVVDSGVAGGGQLAGWRHGHVTGADHSDALVAGGRHAFWRAARSRRRLRCFEKVTCHWLTAAVLNSAVQPQRKPSSSVYSTFIRSPSSGRPTHTNNTSVTLSPCARRRLALQHD